MFKKIFSLLLFCCLTHSLLLAQKKSDFVTFINQQHNWVDSVFNNLTPKQKIAQLFLVRAHTNLGQRYIDSVATVIKNEQLGGLVVFQGGPVRHVNMFNQYQKVSKVPLLITYDGEWGLGMRLQDSTLSYPYQMTLGAIQNDNLIYDMGRQVAKDFLRMGMHFNFAPVVDINNNPKNPVINFRSFGDHKLNVTRKAKRYMDGMVDGGIIASLKHFPGHGDTDVDSHYDLPQLNFSRKRLDTLEMYPFKELIKAGAPAIMVAHMNIPALDNTPNMPSSISKKVVTDLLRNELNFKGLTVTDAMDMKGVKKFFPNGEADLMAIIAGNDLLEISENSARAIDLINKAIGSGRIKQADIDSRVKRVLAAKLWLSLNKYQDANPKNLYTDLNNASAKSLIQRLADASITVLESYRPIQHFNPKAATAIINIGIDKPQDFQNGLKVQLSNTTEYYIKSNADQVTLDSIAKAIKHKEQLILAIHDNRLRPKSELDFNKEVKDFINKHARNRAITVLFANPYAIASIDVNKSSSIILAYQNDSFMQKAALKVLLKQVKPVGKLPVTISKQFRFGEGI